MDFKKFADDNKIAMINDLNGLLRIESVLVSDSNNPKAPFGVKMVEALNYMLNLGKEMGFIVKNVDNVAGHIEYGEGEEIIGILVHLDVVPAGDGWKYPPFEPTLIEDKLYARGSLDDKGAAVASLYALKALKDMNIKLNKKVRLILGTDEETGCRCIKHYLEKEKMPNLGFSPDANFPLIYGEKGILSLDLNIEYSCRELLSFQSGDRYNVVPDKAVCKTNMDLVTDYQKFLLENEYLGFATTDLLTMNGKRAHAMQPEKGKNAALQLISFLNQHIKHPLIKFADQYLQDSRLKNLHENFCDPEMKDLTMNVAIVDLDQQKGKIGLNFRYPINWDCQGFLERLTNLASKSDIRLNVLANNPPHYISPDDELVKTLHQAYIKYTNDTLTPIITIGGGTYARMLKKAVAFGPMMPGREDVVHQVNEYVHISDLLACIMIFAESLLNLGK